MSLDWGTTDNNANRLTLGTLSIGQATTFTICAWTRLTWTSGTALRVIMRQFSTGGGANQRWLFTHAPDASGNIRVGFTRNHTTTNSFSASTYGDVTKDVWVFSAGTHAGGTSVNKIWIGDESTPCVEPTYTTQNAAAGSLRTGAQPTSIGSTPVNNNEGYTGDIAFVALFDGNLSQSELQAVQFGGIQAALARSDLAGLWMPGMHGTSNVYDFSGAGNTATKTGTLALDNNPIFVSGFPQVGLSRNNIVSVSSAVYTLSASAGVEQILGPNLGLTVVPVGAVFTLAASSGLASILSPDLGLKWLGSNGWLKVPGIAGAWSEEAEVTAGWSGEAALTSGWTKETSV